MVAKQESSATAGVQASLQFWEDLRMQQRQRCEVMQGNSSRNAPHPSHRELHRKALTLASSSRLEQKLNDCLWAQEGFIILVTGLTALWSITPYMNNIDGLEILDNLIGDRRAE
ncbi:hypothetical protein D4764_03G0009880 [Takifugu flavidus]|uniref:Uncharacterized protein n=1 Tax=Takifugu flavidus TaxID=433684 RepID=A0A5C6NDG4_9TELE|nr:hypothetical protein D4764_03G0009880 [Takifugu flavidus]